MNELDFVIPVYNEGENIIPVLESLKKGVQTPFRVLICYDRDDDDTLSTLRAHPVAGVEWIPVKNQFERGPHGAVVSGFRFSQARSVIVLPADDTFNAPIVDRMVACAREGSEIVSASRFIPGGCMEGCPFLKFWLVRIAAFTLHHIARIPTADPTNGFRLFSRRVLDEIEIESNQGFTYSIELLVKVHRLGWKMADVPASWFQRAKGTSRFKIFAWMIPYLNWYFYAFATTFLRLGPATVPMRALNRA